MAADEPYRPTPGSPYMIMDGTGVLWAPRDRDDPRRGFIAIERTAGVPLITKTAKWIAEHTGACVYLTPLRPDARMCAACGLPEVQSVPVPPPYCSLNSAYPAHLCDPCHKDLIRMTFRFVGLPEPDLP